MNTAAKPVSALIVDDEAPMRDMLRARLLEAWPDLQIVGEATNGLEAVSMAESLKPDVVFLDIRMPGQSGIEAARALYNKFHIVFVTAYDQYAVQAFDQGAVDYLLKPVDADRLRVTCERLRERMNDQPDDIANLLNRLVAGKEGNKPAYLKWVQASVGASIRMISTKEILFFMSDEKYTRVQTETAEVLIRKPLKELAEELDPDEFWRIHRSILVRVDAITEVSRDIRGRQLVHIRGSSEKLEVSRNHSHLFQQM
ncbi:MAG TPA: LytTR family DNA-binding domain-containing protein [Burkholderiaceae bacterium]